MPFVSIDMGARLRQRGDHAGHQAIAPLGTLIRIGVGTERDGVLLPGAPTEFFAQHRGDVELDHHLGVEITAGIEVEVFVRRPRETVAARVRTSAKGVDREPKR